MTDNRYVVRADARGGFNVTDTKRVVNVSWHSAYGAATSKADQLNRETKK